MIFDAGVSLAAIRSPVVIRLERYGCGFPYAPDADPFLYAAREPAFERPPDSYLTIQNRLV